MKRILLLLVTIFISLLVFTFFFWFSEIKLFKIKADVSQASFSVENSYLFTTPLRAAASGSEKIRVTVFILNNQGLGVLGKSVSLGQDPNLTIETIQGMSDQFGKAVFDVSSVNKGEYYLEVKVGDMKMNQQAHLTFY